MTTYNTYQEAKIANPDSEIVRWNSSDEYKAVSKRDLSGYLTTWTYCNPADHCMTVEKFLKDEHKFVDGDIYFCIGELEPSIVGVDGFKCEYANTPTGDDATSYILRAKALEEPKKVEWKNGDECIFTDRNGEDKTCKVIGLFPPFVQSYVLHCKSAEPTFFISNAGRMKKPETPEQKAEREKLEAIETMFIELNPKDVKEIYEGHRNSNAWKLCAKAYDAGYRKQ